VPGQGRFGVAARFVDGNSIAIIFGSDIDESDSRWRVNVVAAQ
jgi:hypothetical protein